MTPAILTHTGKMFDLLNPDPTRIDLEDIAHALSNITRFTGHGDLPFTDAQHCVIVSYICPPALARWGLLHDAEEAYGGDVSSPMKAAMRMISSVDMRSDSDYDRVMRPIRRAVAARFGVDIADVREWDEQAALIEAHINGPHSSNEWTWPLPYAWLDLQGETVLPPAKAKKQYLQRAKALGIK